MHLFYPLEREWERRQRERERVALSFSLSRVAAEQPLAQTSNTCRKNCEKRVGLA